MNLKRSALATALLLSTGLSGTAQTTSGGDKYEINLFGGAHFFKRQNVAPNQDLVNGGVAGFRFTQNFWNYVSFEQTGMVHGTANLEFRVPGTGNDYALGARLRQFHFNPVLHLKPRESRVRPFVTMGFGLDWFGITDEARRQVGNGVNTPFRQTVRLESMFRPAFNYGAGVKAKLTDRVGLRFDVRGFATASSDFGIPSTGPAGAIVYTRTTPFNAMQTTGGITFYMGPIDQGPVCSFTPGSIEPASNTIWLSESASYKISTNNNCMGVTPKYKWTVDGQPVSGDDMIAVKGLKAGDSAVKVTVEADTSKVTDKKTRNYLKKFPIAAVERSATLSVKQPVIELVSVSMDPSSIAYNGSSVVTSVFRYDGPSAGEDISLSYQTQDGCLVAMGGSKSISSDCKTATGTLHLKPGLNEDKVRFEASSIRLTPGGPSRTVTVRGEAKDASGKTYAKSGTVSVASPAAPPPPPAAPPKLMPMQLDDVIFTKGGTRVNNCGKRVIDQAFERAASMGDYDVLLVGHYDAVEKNIKVRDRKAKTTRTLDEERVLNVAAVLSAGVEPCKRLDRNRIKVAYVGAEQLSPFKTSLCEATVKERGGSKINAKDGNAKNRRVEVWLVPKSGPNPNGIAGIQNAPADAVASKACPK